MATLYVNLVNFGPVTSQFNRVVGVHTLHLKNKPFKTNYLRIYLIDFHQVFTVW